MRIVRLFRSLPRASEAEVIGKKLLRRGTSVAANYRAVCRARSKREFISRVGVVLEEADETVFWLEMLYENEILPKRRLQPLLDEARELTAIFTASERTAKGRRGSITQLPDYQITQSHHG
jgi:four helix bundle protein